MAGHGLSTSYATQILGHRGIPHTIWPSYEAPFVPFHINIISLHLFRDGPLFSTPGDKLLPLATQLFLTITKDGSCVKQLIA